MLCWYQITVVYLLKLFQEWGEGRIKKNDEGDEFKYDIFNIL
jgi:hypothetical protein